MLVLLTHLFLYHVATVMKRGGSLEVAQEYRNLEFDARGSEADYSDRRSGEWHISTSEELV